MEDFIEGQGGDVRNMAEFDVIYIFAIDRAKLFIRSPPEFTFTNRTFPFHDFFVLQ
jgi:hypothetical protein